jgi:hypothetical protein
MPAQTAKPTDDLNVYSFIFICFRLVHAHGEKKIKKKRVTENSYSGHKTRQIEMSGYLV